jgi:hypothetical protein
MTFEIFKAAVTARGWMALDRGNSHWQIRQSPVNKTVINWWPRSPNRTCHVSELNQKFDDCDMNAVLAVAVSVYRSEAA